MNYLSWKRDDCSGNVCGKFKFFSAVPFTLKYDVCHLFKQPVGTDSVRSIGLVTIIYENKL